MPLGMLLLSGHVMHAAAFVVGSNEGASAVLAGMARGLGFDVVERYRSLRQAERQLAETPLAFFLCTAVARVAELRPMAEAIRFSESLKLRFSPLIYFPRDPSIEDTKACISMGFDDVIALPYAGADLGSRLARQVGKPFTYYETPTYFGPDRRNRNGNTRSADGDHGGGYRRIEIVRNPLTGIELLSDDSQFVI